MSHTLGGVQYPVHIISSDQSSSWNKFIPDWCVNLVLQVHWTLQWNAIRCQGNSAVWGKWWPDCFCLQSYNCHPGKSRITEITSVWFQEGEKNKETCQIYNIPIDKLRTFLKHKEKRSPSSSLSWLCLGSFLQIRGLNRSGMAGLAHSLLGNWKKLEKKYIKNNLYILREVNAFPGELGHLTHLNTLKNPNNRAFFQLIV